MVLHFLIMFAFGGVSFAEGYDKHETRRASKIDETPVEHVRGG